MPASTSWLEGGLEEVGGSGRGWVSDELLPAPQCRAASAVLGVLRRRVPVRSCFGPACWVHVWVLAGQRTQVTGNRGVPLVCGKGELLYWKRRTSEEIVIFWKKAWKPKRLSG